MPPRASRPCADTSCRPPTMSRTADTGSVSSPGEPSTWWAPSACDPSRCATSPVVAITSAPPAAASCTANRPTPPEAPVTSTRLPRIEPTGAVHTARSSRRPGSCSSDRNRCGWARRSRGAHRRRSRHSEGVDHRRQGQTLRFVGGRCDDYQPRPRRAAGGSAAKRILALDAKPRSRDHSDLGELGIGLVPYSPLGKGYLTGTLDCHTSLADDLRRMLPRFTPEARQANGHWSTCCGRSPTTREPHQPRSLSPGCWRGSRGSCRSPAPPNCIAWKRTWEHSMSN
ncbi:hypothetical protein SAMN04489730_6443 [Amycolatopsis australiensis]|uniref:Aldo/keto reductase family protein n=1 Tax=Amycolatopsis australiensis TaxID=546364 RepID=A0A1K1SQE7_9PSEU|nr:hypothetical protein SAMN04489730_6443 [Amycolatopsis australiensis]